jgi:hypothetical protein
VVFHGIGSATVDGSLAVVDGAVVGDPSVVDVVDSSALLLDTPLSAHPAASDTAVISIPTSPDVRHRPLM